MRRFDSLHHVHSEATDMTSKGNMIGRWDGVMPSCMGQRCLIIRDASGSVLGLRCVAQPPNSLAKVRTLRDSGHQFFRATQTRDRTIKGDGNPQFGDQALRKIFSKAGVSSVAASVMTRTMKR